MAANDYYNTTPTGHANPYRDYDYPVRHDAPLSPLPQQSPFDNDTYRTYSGHQHPPQSYSGANGRIHDDADPFEDDNAIPLNGRKPKHESTHTISPILPHEQDDPFVRDADPRKQKQKRRRSKQGWFRGKITWVVYVLTIAQLIVFIAQIVRNGKRIDIRPDRNMLTRWQRF